MYKLITTKGRETFVNLNDAAEWFFQMQPSSARIVWGDVEAELDKYEGMLDNVYDEDYAAAAANMMRWALRLAEANALDLTINNENIYLAGFGGTHVDMAYLRADVACIMLVDNMNEVKRELLDSESLADVLAAVQRGE